MSFSLKVFSQEKKREQEPVRPFSYVEKEVSFTNPADGTVLKGTLTLPDESKRYPAVVLISGSGAQNRDEEILGHKPFMVIADYLTKAGIAVLRYDDRHFGMSIKEGWKYTTADLAGDAASAFDFLYHHSNIDTSFIGLAGHSEGGVIAPMVAAENKQVAFVISLAGTGLKGIDILRQQGKDICENEKDTEFQLKAVDIIANETDIKIREKAIRALNTQINGRFNLKSRFQLKQMIDMITSDWNRYFILYNPAEAWAKVTCPVLAINGEYDIQVIAKDNLNAIEQALILGGNKNYTVKIIPKLNHLFQTVEAGGPKKYSLLIKEYNDARESFSPVALKLISEWILSEHKNCSSL